MLAQRHPRATSWGGRGAQCPAVPGGACPLIAEQAARVGLLKSMRRSCATVIHSAACDVQATGDQAATDGARPRLRPRRVSAFPHSGRVVGLCSPVPGDCSPTRLQTGPRSRRAAASRSRHLTFFASTAGCSVPTSEASGREPARRRLVMNRQSASAGRSRPHFDRGTRCGAAPHSRAPRRYGARDSRRSCRVSRDRAPHESCPRIGIP
jgi:hypothetical protein